MNQREIYEYYSRGDVQSALLAHAASREVVGVFRAGAFDRRPNTIANAADIPALVRSGVVEFHCSIERWKNPMSISGTNYDSLREGFDIVFDLDVDSLEHAKTAAQIIFNTLRKHGIESCGVKFSGGTGLHICMPWESMPEAINFQPTSKLFPSIARVVVSYLKQCIAEDLEAALLAEWNPEELARAVGAETGSILTATGIDPFKIVEIDTVLVSPRHLYRMPFSLNRKTFLVSAPIDPSKIKSFTAEQAKPEALDFSIPFLRKPRKNEAEALLMGAVEWNAKMERKAKKRFKRPAAREQPVKAVPKEFFPPCIKLILEGLAEGRKRSVFILINFLSTMKWSNEEIESSILEWNQRNRPPLPESYVRGQLRYFTQKGKAIPPPNCLNEAYYLSFGVCKPDQTCRSIKNPASYPLVKLGEDQR